MSSQDSQLGQQPQYLVLAEKAMRDAAYFARALREPRIYDGAYDAEKLGPDQYYVREVAAVVQVLIPTERDGRVTADILRSLAKNDKGSLQVLATEVIRAWSSTVPGLSDRITSDQVIAYIKS